MTVLACQRTWYRLSGTLSRWTWSADIGRISSVPIDASGRPVASAMSSAAAFSPMNRTRIRAAVAPAACSDTPLHENGSSAWPSVPRPIPCRAASNSAGCRAKPVTSCSVGISTSTYTSSMLRQAAFTPRNAGP